MVKFTEKQTKDVILGLEGINAVATIKSKVDGSGAGSLYYEGYNIIDLAEKSNYEEVVFLLLYDKLPKKQELDSFKEKLNSLMAIDENIVALMRLVKDDHPMAALRTIISSLSSIDKESEDGSIEANERKALKLIAKLPIIIASFHRIREEKDIIHPEKGLSLAENFVLMLNGEKDEMKAKVVDLFLILLADHGLNASTFTARSVASTNSDIYSTVTAAMGSLKGPLHGGANEKVIKMLMEIEGDAKDYVMKKLSRKERIMGIGHRVYKGGDPRAKILKKYAKELSEKEGKDSLFKHLEIIEDIMEKEKCMKPNVDFYSALVLDCIGIPSDLFTPMFAMSRIAGWCAHVLEQYQNNRLMRPKGVYVEELAPLGKKYVDIENR